MLRKNVAFFLLRTSKTNSKTNNNCAHNKIAPVFFIWGVTSQKNNVLRPVILCLFNISPKITGNNRPFCGDTFFEAILAMNALDVKIPTHVNLCKISPSSQKLQVPELNPLLTLKVSKEMFRFLDVKRQEKTQACCKRKTFSQTKNRYFKMIQTCCWENYDLQEAKIVSDLQKFEGRACVCQLSWICRCFPK